MKKNIFAETYTQVQELKKQYNTAKYAEDEAGMQAARDAYNLLMDGISTVGESSVRIYRLYEEAHDCGNEYIDFSEVVWDKDVAGMVAALRENGITHFTFSSGWSGAVDTAWLFTQNGCRLEGLVRSTARIKHSVQMNMRKRTVTFSASDKGMGLQGSLSRRENTKNGGNSNERIHND